MTANIPKIIHQTWKKKELPENFYNWSQSWKTMNPEFKYCFYNDMDCWKFMYNNYPEYLDLYEDLKPVEKADIFRYLVLHKYGGVYADMDTECYRPISSLLEQYDRQLITGIEYEGPEIGYPYTPNGVQLQQWFIASPQNHPVLIKLVNEIQNRWWWRWLYSLVKTPNQVTYWLTGPEVFTDVVKEAGNIIIMPKGILGSYDPRRITRDSYLQHHFAGTWKPLRIAVVPPP